MNAMTAYMRWRERSETTCVLGHTMRFGCCHRSGAHRPEAYMGRQESNEIQYSKLGGDDSMSIRVTRTSLNTAHEVSLYRHEVAGDPRSAGTDIHFYNRIGAFYASTETHRE